MYQFDDRNSPAETPRFDLDRFIDQELINQQDAASIAVD